jgi:hypothetical protein
MRRSHIPCVWIIAAALFPATVFAQTPKPTFARDIAPILYSKCAMCHRAGEVAPMSLTSYDEVRPWARAIKSKIVSRQMPPWYAEGEAGKWRNDRRLTQAEIDKITAWVDAGAPRGDDRDLPALPQFARGWNHPSGRPPDLIIEAPEAKVPAEGESPWQNVYVKLPFQGDVWVEAAQGLPSNRAVVHHVVVSSTTLPPNATLDAEGHLTLPRGSGSVDPTGQVSNARPPQAAGGAIPGPGGLFVGWEPGVDVPISYGPDVAERISGTHLAFNIHYQANGKETTNKSRIGLWFQRNPVRHATTGPSVGMGSETFIFNGQELAGRYSAQVTTDILPAGIKTVPNIPAGADNYRLTVVMPIRQDMVLYSIQPHMHVRGRSIKYTATFPDGREEELLNVPHYDFNWQIVYEYAKPVTLPAGTTVRVEAAWDNSTKNKYNPRPDQDVRWGEQSWDEMLSPQLRAVLQLSTPVTPVLPAPLSP